MNNRRGQILIEMILMMIVLLGATFFISSQFRQNNFIATMVSGPWQNLSGMIQNGVWQPPQEGMKNHPNTFQRWTTPLGEKAKQ